MKAKDWLLKIIEGNKNVIKNSKGIVGFGEKDNFINIQDKESENIYAYFEICDDNALAGYYLIFTDEEIVDFSDASFLLDGESFERGGIQESCQLIDEEAYETMVAYTGLELPRTIIGKWMSTVELINAPAGEHSVTVTLQGKSYEGTINVGLHYFVLQDTDEQGWGYVISNTADNYWLSGAQSYGTFYIGEETTVDVYISEQDPGDPVEYEVDAETFPEFAGFVGYEATVGITDAGIYSVDYEYDGLRSEMKNNIIIA